MPYRVPRKSRGKKHPGRVTPELKLPVPGEGEVVSGGQTQAHIDEKLGKVIEKYSSVFEGLGRSKTKPIHIFLKDGVVPVQQKLSTTRRSCRTPYRSCPRLELWRGPWNPKMPLDGYVIL